LTLLSFHTHTQHTDMENTFDEIENDYKALLYKDYKFDLGNYIDRGWKMFSANMGGFVSYTFLIFFLVFAYFVVVFGGLFFGISLLGGLDQTMSIVGYIVFGMLCLLAYMGMIFGGGLLVYGYFYVANQIQQAGTYQFSDFFGAFKHWKQLIAYDVVRFLLLLVAAIPSIAFLGFSFLMPILQGEIHFPDDILNNTLQSKLNNFSQINTLLSLPIYYLTTSYALSPFLIMFQGLGYWDAMELSRKIVGKKFFWFLLFYYIVQLIMSLGIIALLIGIVFTIPAGMCMLYAAYHQIVAGNRTTVEDQIAQIGQKNTEENH
jgi:hypothetical protein